MAGASTPHLSVATERILPGLQVVSSSTPDPLLRRHNLLLFQQDLDAARRLVVELEGELGDVALGFVAFGRGPVAEDAGAMANAADEAAGPGDDLIHWWGGPVLLGSAIGALLGAATFLAAGSLLGVTGGVLGGGAVGVGLLVAVFVAVVMSFRRMGGSDAFRQTFIPHGATEVAVVAVLSDDPSQLVLAREHAADPDITKVELDAGGYLVEGSRRGR